jgi:Family of unknown function (DUF6166)/Family of unknown function (DUF6011)
MTFQPYLVFIPPTAANCRRCNKVLKNQKSIDAGIGPVCAGKEKVEMSLTNPSQTADIDFDPQTRDITCRRDSDNEFRLHFNIDQRHKHHSPSGFEWGYNGSGPNDFALNILARFILTPEVPPPPAKGCSDEEWNAWLDADTRTTTLWDATVVHADVYALHNEFCRVFVAQLPKEGGTIPGAAVEDWIAEKRKVLV